MLRRLPFLSTIAGAILCTVPALAQFQTCVFCDVRPTSPDPFDVIPCDTGTLVLKGVGFQDKTVDGCASTPVVAVRSTRPDRLTILAFRVLGDGTIEVDYSVPCSASEGLTGIDVTIDDNTTDTIAPFACGNARVFVAGVCGNGVVDSGEECDDGNTVSGDGCSATCHREALAVHFDGFGAQATGDGVVVRWQTALESGTLGFLIAARDAAGQEVLLPDPVRATGSESSYVQVDRSGAARAGGRVGYRVIELTVNGTGDATPWFGVAPAGALPRDSAPGARQRSARPTVAR